MDYDYEDYWDEDEDDAPWDTVPDSKETKPLPPLGIEIPSDTLNRWAYTYMKEVFNPRTLRAMMQEKVDAILDTKIDGWLQEQISRKTVELVHDFFERDRTVTNRYGEKVDAASPEKLADAVLAKMERILKKGSEEYRDKRSILTRIVEEELMKPLAKDIKGMMEEIRTEQAEAAKNMVAEMFTEALSKAKRINP